MEQQHLKGSNNQLSSVYCVENNRSVSLSWSNVNVFVQQEKRRCFFKTRREEKTETKHILKEVNGEVMAGQLLAIMGASGSGKTTLMNFLTNTEMDRMITTGQILVNGQDIGSKISKISAYVEQHDIFTGTLTVKEHLVFAAALRMDSHVTDEERKKRIDDVINEMGLSNSTNKIIGVPGWVKGISGGEAKRLAFATEILTNPSLLFLDEPTSGLDSFTALNILRILKDMTKGGRTILCTIHQPSSAIFNMFDNLMLLAEGRVAYLGPASGTLDFFERIDLHCPLHFNPAEFAINNLAIIPGIEEECSERINAVCLEFLKMSAENAHGSDLSKQKKISAMFIKSDKIELSIYLSENVTPNIESHENKRFLAPFSTQLKMLIWRSCLQAIREPKFTRSQISEAIVSSNNN